MNASDSALQVRGRAQENCFKYFGLLKRRSKWTLTWRGWLCFFLATALLLWLLVVGICPFLSVTKREKTDLLVVEGWVHQFVIQKSVEEFREGTYKQVFTTGGPVVGNGGYVNDYQTSASVGAGNLKKAGLAEEYVQMVPSRISDRDRTYSSAIALRDWLQEHHAAVHSFNIVTENTHARRTRLLFQKAFGRDVKIGVIAVPNPDYDQQHWWRYSEGVKDVISEGAAYIYARFFFWPASSLGEIRPKTPNAPN